MYCYLNDFTINLSIYEIRSRFTRFREQNGLHYYTKYLTLQWISLTPVYDYDHDTEHHMPRFIRV